MSVPSDPSGQPGWTAPGSPVPPPAGGPSYGGPSPYGAPSYASSRPAWGAPHAPPAHKPGIVALRPLGLGDIFDGAFTAIRQNPRAMLGWALVVTAGFLVLPALVGLLLSLSGDLTGPSLTFPDTADPDAGAGTATGDAGFGVAVALSYAGQLAGVLASLVLTGMLVHVVAQAVLGRRSTMAETWRAVRGRVLRLLGLIALAVLVLAVVVGLGVAVVFLTGRAGGDVAAVVVGVALVLLLGLGAVYCSVRLLLLAAPALVLERVGIRRALGRAWELSRGQFWRLFGIYLLTTVTTGIVGAILGIPFSLLALGGTFLLPEPAAGLTYVLGTYAGLVVTQTVTTPFTAAVVALQYVDQRIRKEAFDVQLIASLGPAPGGPA